MDENPELVPLLESRDLAYVIASASSDEGLLEAGVQGAAAIVAARRSRLLRPATPRSSRATRSW